MPVTDHPNESDGQGNWSNWTLEVIPICSVSFARIANPAKIMCGTFVLNKKSGDEASGNA
jgi:hypothetical protein